MFFSRCQTADFELWQVSFAGHEDSSGIEVPSRFDKNNLPGNYPYDFIGVTQARDGKTYIFITDPANHTAAGEGLDHAGCSHAVIDALW